MKMMKFLLIPLRLNSVTNLKLQVPDKNANLTQLSPKMFKITRAYLTRDRLRENLMLIKQLLKSCFIAIKLKGAL